MNNVIDIEDYKPHVSIVDMQTSNVHVLPMSLIVDIASGERDITTCDHETLTAMIRCLANASLDTFRISGEYNG